MKNDKPCNEWTKAELKALPHREWNEEIICEGIIILPENLSEGLHDSGYRYMDFVAIKDDKPFCRLAGGADVIHINGIGGYGEWAGSIPKQIDPISWSIDCLPKSGLLRLFCGRPLKCGPALSSFEVIALERLT